MLYQIELAICANHYIGTLTTFSCVFLIFCQTYKTISVSINKCREEVYWQTVLVNTFYEVIVTLH